MRESIKAGMNFGFTSGVITTLGLMVGLYSGTGSMLAVIGGILTIAIADAMSDALGIHISKEGENTHSEKDIWLATGATFLSKFLMSITFLIPVLLFNLTMAVIVSIGWGLIVLSAMSYYLARVQNVSPVRVIGEHISIAALVVATTYQVGNWISATFS
ncbi:MAG: hypothetical protein MJA83_11080 [Gammaproteobacteria bacterium]|nr:hypothetical protein [Gammaproteobacteria bacterium]